MEKKLNIYSCQQDWNKMQETENGRMCERCNRCLVDFRKMELEAIHDFQRKAKKEQICGVYRPDQIARAIPIHQIPRKKKKKWWALAASLATAFASTGAMMPSPLPILTHQFDFKTMHTSEATPCCTIKGLITDSEGEPILFGTVQLKDSETWVQTDFDGNFELEVFDPAARKEGHVELLISYVGYDSVIHRIPNEELQEFQKIELESTVVLKEVVVLGMSVPVFKDPTPKQHGLFNRIFAKRKKH